MKPPWREGERRGEEEEENFRTKVAIKNSVEEIQLKIIIFMFFFRVRPTVVLKFDIDVFLAKKTCSWKRLVIILKKFYRKFGLRSINK